jgi:hypothetical protein
MGLNSLTRPPGGVRGSQESAAFLKKSSKERLPILRSECVGNTESKWIKVFCFFFSKKKRFLT